MSTLYYTSNRVTSSKGGHTSEALLLLSAIDLARYTPRTYVVSEGDTLSVQRALAFESSKAASTSNNASRFLAASFLFLMTVANSL